MEEPTKAWMKSVIAAVGKLQADYKINRGMLLTEGDLECHMFNKLMCETSLSGFHSSANNNGRKGEKFRTSYVHSQVTWFKPSQLSGFEVDLSIGSPENLQVENIDLFEEYPHKGFAHDGPSIAIELKFIRSLKSASQIAQVDYLKLRNELMPAKFNNIDSGLYKRSKRENTAFVSIVGCKNEMVFDKALEYLPRQIDNLLQPCPDNLFVCVFCQDEIKWYGSKIFY